MPEKTTTTRRIIIITGATSGIGRGLAERYAATGQIVGAIARRAEVLDELRRGRPTIIPLPCDVTDGPAMEQIISRFALEHGGLDMIIANAGVGQESPEGGWDPEVARRIAEINIVGATNTIAPAVPIMIDQRSGRIVGVSSLAGHTPLPCAAAYGASKAWLRFYLESLDMDLEPFGVRCSIVMPGHVSTAMVDGPQVGLLTDDARRAAELIAMRLDRGDRIIRFPRRVSILTRLAAWAPRSIKVRAQRARLARRQAARAVDRPH